MRTLLLAAVVVLTATRADAQLGSFNPEPGPQGTYAIRNARIITVTGAEITGGTVLISGGKIAAVGPNASVMIPTGTPTIDANGLRVYPGMFDTGTSMGLNEIPQGANATVDDSEVGSFNPNAQAIFAINPHSAHIGTTRVVGITHAVSRPTGGVVAGQAALVNLAGTTAPSMSVVPRVALVVELPRSSFGGRGGAGGLAAAQGSANTQDVNRVRTAQLDSLRQMLKDAEAYGRVHDAYAKDKSLPRPASDVVLASLVPVVRGEMPVMFIADRAPDMREAVTFARDNKLKPIIVGGRDAWQIADYLKENNVPVLLTGILALPSREDDPYDVNYAAPAKLAAAGVKFAITSGDAGAEARNLPYVAGMAAAFGLDPLAALKAVTLWPAEIFGVADRVGSIEVGKMANLVVTDGDILEARTVTRYLFVDGRPVPLDTKHTVLFERFKDR